MNAADSLPPPVSGSGLTELLQAWREGDGRAFSTAVERVYGELKRIAALRIAAQQHGGTLSPTELVHEAMLGMLQAPMDFTSRTHFLATMSLAMRSVLVDHARARAALKRGGNGLRLSLGRVDAGDAADHAVDLLTLEQALAQLEALDPRCGQVMHLTYFGGLEQDEIAALLQVSIPTVKRDLRFARAWLMKAMADAG